MSTHLADSPKVSRFDTGHVRVLGWLMQREMNVLALHKGTEHYLFLYDDQSLPSLIDLFRRYATDAELSFNWFDAAVMSEKGKKQLDLEQAGQQKHTPRFPAETR